MNTKSWTRVALASAVVGLVGALYFSGWLDELTFAKLKAAREDLRAWVATNEMRAVAGYFGLYVLATAVSIPGAAVLTLAGGAVFGFWRGVLIVSVASTVGATLCFLASRFLFRDWVHDRFASLASRIDTDFRRDGAYYLFTLRLVPAVPFFLINLVFGLTDMGTVTFYLVSQAGMLPGTLAYVNAGTRLGDLESPSEIFSPGVLMAFAILALLPWLGRGFSKLWRPTRPGGDRTV